MLPRACFRCFLVLLAAVAVLAVIRGAAWVRERDGRVPAHLRSVATPLGRVTVDEHGVPTRPTVLIVPGTAGWSGFWRDVSSHLAARGYHVVAVDLPPFGYSEHDAAAHYDRRSQAARLSAVLATTARGPAIVVAHSFGGGSATEFALGHPDQVARLVLVDGALGELDPSSNGGVPLLRSAVLSQPLIAATLTNPHAIGALSRSMLAKKEAAARWRETLRAPMRRPGTTAAYAAWLPSLLAADDGASSRRSSALRLMKPPVRLIWGEADTVTPIAQGLQLSRLLGAPITRLPGVGHVPHIEDAVHFLPALDAAIAEPVR